MHWVARQFARVTPAENSAKWFNSKGRVKRGPPCPRACSEFETCNGGTKCPLYRQAVHDFGEGTDAFARFLLARGPFQAWSRYAPLNSQLRDHPEGIPEDAALPRIKTRRHKKHCERPNCMGGPNCRGGRICERRNSWRLGELDPDLQEEFIGPVNMPWHMREAGRVERCDSSSDSDRDMPARPRPRDAERQPDAAKRPSVAHNLAGRLDAEFQRRALLPWQS